MVAQNRKKSHKCDFTQQELSHSCDSLPQLKLRAIDLLLLGKTQKEVASEIGVCREAISRWSNHNPVFIATLNQRREHLLKEQTELFGSLEKAVHLLEQALDSAYCLEDSEVKAALKKIKTFVLGDDCSKPLATAQPESQISVLELHRRRSCRSKALTAFVPPYPPAS